MLTRGAFLRGLATSAAVACASSGAAAPPVLPSYNDLVRAVSAKSAHYIPPTKTYPYGKFYVALDLWDRSNLAIVLADRKGQFGGYSLFALDAGSLLKASHEALGKPARVAQTERCLEGLGQLTVGSWLWKDWDLAYKVVPGSSPTLQEFKPGKATSMLPLLDADWSKMPEKVAALGKALKDSREADKVKHPEIRCLPFQGSRIGVLALGMTKGEVAAKLGAAHDNDGAYVIYPNSNPDLPFSVYGVEFSGDKVVAVRVKGKGSQPAIRWERFVSSFGLKEHTDGRFEKTDAAEKWIKQWGAGFEVEYAADKLTYSYSITLRATKP